MSFFYVVGGALMGKECVQVEIPPEAQLSSQLSLCCLSGLSNKDEYDWAYSLKKVGQVAGVFSLQKANVCKYFVRKESVHDMVWREKEQTECMQKV